MLAVPNIKRKEAIRLPVIAENDSLLMCSEDLMDIDGSFGKYFGRRTFQNSYPSPTRRNLFLNTEYGKRKQLTAAALYREYLEWRFYKDTTGRLEILDYAQSYTRFAITGSSGSGKTWLLMELALRWAAALSELDAKPILFLCFNLPLAKNLEALKKRLASNHDQDPSRIVIKSWEQLVHDLCSYVSVDPAGWERFDFFEKELPVAIGFAIEQQQIPRLYSGLIVDEAQDHATSDQDLKLPFGWWTLYQHLLHNVAQAPIAVAYDTNQRRPFLKKSEFEVSRLLEFLGPRHIELHCPAPLRYTREIAEFLSALAKQVPIEFDAPPKRIAELPHHSPVVSLQISRQETMKVLSTLVMELMAKDGVKPADILIVTARSTLSESELSDTVGNIKIESVDKAGPHSIKHVSRGRCKGIEAKQVIMVGFEPLRHLDLEQRRAYFIAASRAMEGLVILEVLPMAPAMATPSYSPR